MPPPTTLTTTPSAPASTEHKRQAAREVVDILHDMSGLLDARLTRQQLSYCVSLIENGVNPVALADVIKALRARYPDPSLDAELPADEEAEEEEEARSGAAAQRQQRRT